MTINITEKEGLYFLIIFCKISSTKVQIYKFSKPGENKPFHTVYIYTFRFNNRPASYIICFYMVPVKSSNIRLRNRLDKRVTQYIEIIEGVTSNIVITVTLCNTFHTL